MSINVPLHWWYIPIFFVMLAAFFWWRMNAVEHRFAHALIDFLLCGACLAVAIVSALVGWWVA